MDSPPKPAPVLDEATHNLSFWSANKRRPVFLVALVLGLGLFLAWLPAGSRASLLKAFEAQRLLVALLLVFALVTLSLIWSAGQRLASQLFRLFNLRGERPGWLNIFMLLATQLGSMPAALVTAALFLLLRYRRLTVEIVLGTLSLWLLVETIKALA